MTVHIHVLEAAAAVGGLDDAGVLFYGELERQLLGDAMPWRRIVVTAAAAPMAGAALVLAAEPLPVPQLPDPPATALTPGDAPFYLVHLMRFAEGGEAGVAGYAASAGAAGLALGVRPMAMFSVSVTPGGEGRQWDQVRFNRFPSLATFEELLADPTHRAGQALRQASLAGTYAFMVAPRVERWAQPSVIPRAPG